MYKTDAMEGAFREIEEKSLKGEELSEAELALAQALGAVEALRDIESRKMKQTAETEEDKNQ